MAASRARAARWELEARLETVTEGDEFESLWRKHGGAAGGARVAPAQAARVPPSPDPWD